MKLVGEGAEEMDEKIALELLDGLKKKYPISLVENMEDTAVEGE